MQNLEIAEVAQATAVENLNLLSSGPIPPNPAEILNSESTRALWGRLQEEYDYILVDGPPVLAVADASILAGQVDGVILVLWSGHSRIDAARQAKEQLSRAGANLIGVVLNQVEVKRNNYYYNYGSYYYYGYGEGSARKK